MGGWLPENGANALAHGITFSSDNGNVGDVDVVIRYTLGYIMAPPRQLQSYAVGAPLDAELLTVALVRNPGLVHELCAFYRYTTPHGSKNAQRLGPARRITIVKAGSFIITGDRVQPMGRFVCALDLEWEESQGFGKRTMTQTFLAFEDGHPIPPTPPQRPIPIRIA